MVPIPIPVVVPGVVLGAATPGAGHTGGYAGKRAGPQRSRFLCAFRGCADGDCRQALSRGLGRQAATDWASEPCTNRCRS